MRVTNPGVELGTSVLATRVLHRWSAPAPNKTVRTPAIKSISIT